MKLTEKQQQWIAYLLVTLVIAATSTFLGVNYPVPPPPVFTQTGDEIVALGTTHFTNLEAEDITATDDLTVTDDATIGGDMTVSGTASWGCSTSTINNNLILTGTLTAEDATITDTLNVDGDIDLDGDGFDVNITDAFSIDGDAASNINVAGAGIDLTIESEAGRVVVKADEATADAIHLDANEAVTTGIDIDVGSVSGLTIDGGLVNIGGGSPDVAAGDNDLYVTGDLEVDGELQLDGTVDVNAVMTGLADLEHLFFPTIVISDVAYASATGSTGAVATIADGEIWFVWAVFVNVTTDFDCTGDDATLIVGDGADTDGFTVLADAELQIADTEQTGSPAGWQGLVAATMGVYLDGAVSSAPHIYAPSGAAETIDYLISEGTGDTLTGGEATIYVIYTRIQ